MSDNLCVLHLSISDEVQLKMHLKDRLQSFLSILKLLPGGLHSTFSTFNADFMTRSVLTSNTFPQLNLFLSVFTHRGRWFMLLRTLHPTAASATHPCLPSTRPPLFHLPKAHRPVSASSTAGADLRPTLGHLTTPTPCLTRTPSPTTPLPTSSHNSTSPTTPSRPSVPPPVPSWSAGT